ncbi:pilus assembly protein PilM [bacterium]
MTASTAWPQVLGVEINNEAVQYVLLNRKAGKSTVESFGRFSFKGGQDSIEGLYEAVPHLFKSSHFRHAKLIIGIDESIAVVKTESFPNLSDKELKQTIAFSFEKELAGGEEGSPIVCGSYPLGPDPDKKENKLHMVVGMYEDEVHQIVQPFVDQGLLPVKVVVRMMALGNLAVMLPQGKKDVPIGILNIGTNKSMLTIFRNGQLDFYREIVMGDIDFTKAIIGTIFHEGKAIQFSMDEAAEFKNKFGYPLGFVDSMSFKGAPLSELGAMMRPVVERLTGEIQRSIGFYSDKTKGDSVSSLYLIGKGAKIKHLDQVLNSRVGVPVARLPMPKKVAVAGGKKPRGIFQKKFFDHTVSLAVASETTLEGSLLPPVYKLRQLQATIQKWGTIVGLAFLGWMVLSAAGVFTRTTALKKEIRVAEKIALEAETAEQRYARAMTQGNQLDEEILSIHRRVQQDEDLVQILRLFSQKLPNELLVSSFEYRWEMPKQQQAPKGKKAPKVKNAEEVQDEPKAVRILSFEGGSNAPDADVKIAVADFLIILQESGYFKTVNLIDELLTETNDENGELQSIYWFQVESVLTE